MPIFRDSVRHELAVRVLTVRSIIRRSPNVVRVVAGGADLEGFTTLSPMDHVKLLVPGPDGVLPEVPEVVDGRIRFGPDGPPPLRDYTVRAFDAAANTLTLDIAVHEGGHVSRWADQAHEGETIVIGGPRGSHLTPIADHYVMIGDLTSLPAIERWISEMPGTAAVHTLVALDHPDDAVHFESEASVTPRWIHNGRVEVAADLLAAAVAELPLPVGDRYVWAAGEVIAMRGVRDALIAAGLTEEEYGIDGYWRRGRADHDHHAPIDAD